ISVLCNPSPLMPGSWKAISTPRVSMNSWAATRSWRATRAIWRSLSMVGLSLSSLEVRCALLDEGPEGLAAVLGGDDRPVVVGLDGDELAEAHRLGGDVVLLHAAAGDRCLAGEGGDDRG